MTISISLRLNRAHLPKADRPRAPQVILKAPQVVAQKAQAQRANRQSQNQQRRKPSQKPSKAPPTAAADQVSLRQLVALSV